MTPTRTPDLVPCLWFDDDLEAAVRFWVGIVPGSEITDLQRNDDGTVFTGEWTIAGRAFRGLNGGPMHAGFKETFSLSVSCDDQAEVDYYWDSLTADGGEDGRCGWLKDRFGMSWQIVPTRLMELLGDPDPARAGAAMQAMLGMQRIVIADLEAAADAATTA